MNENQDHVTIPDSEMTIYQRFYLEQANNPDNSEEERAKYKEMLGR